MKKIESINILSGLYNKIFHTIQGEKNKTWCSLYGKVHTASYGSNLHDPPPHIPDVVFWDFKMRSSLPFLPTRQSK